MCHMNRPRRHRLAGVIPHAAQVRLRFSTGGCDAAFGSAAHLLVWFKRSRDTKGCYMKEPTCSTLYHHVSKRETCVRTACHDMRACRILVGDAALHPKRRQPATGSQHSLHMQAYNTYTACTATATRAMRQLCSHTPSQSCRLLRSTRANSQQRQQLSRMFASASTSAAAQQPCGTMCCGLQTLLMTAHDNLSPNAHTSGRVPV